GQRRHVDRLAVGLLAAFVLRVRRAGLHTHAAAGAVFGRYLERVLHAFPGAALGFHRLPAFRRAAVGKLGAVDLHADRGVRADKRALVALDADRRIPDGDLGRDVALLVLPRRGRERAI